MPLDVEARTAPLSPERCPQDRALGSPIVIGLVNNMPDSALHSTEAQFGGLLQAASGSLAVRLRLSSFPELPRAAEAQEHIRRSYWPIDDLLSGPLDALIVTGTEPRAARLADEPYWSRSVQLLAFAQEHTVSSVWSCLAAHAAVLSLDGIERRRLPQKRCGVYPHSLLENHPLLAGVRAPMAMPHSRWNELSPEELRGAGYTLLSWSAETGADAFVREDRSLLLFFQGHPEYEDATLLKEYRRDVARYLSGQQSHYPALPRGYLSADATLSLQAFREAALAKRDAALLECFPFSAVAAGLENSWRASALAIYRNWLSIISTRRLPRSQPLAATAAEPQSA
jgi:homoserine O-succinyltransferase/O-acetyltransferase